MRFWKHPVKIKPAIAYTLLHIHSIQNICMYKLCQFDWMQQVKVYLRIVNTPKIQVFTVILVAGPNNLKHIQIFTVKKVIVHTDAQNTLLVTTVALI